MLIRPYGSNLKTFHDSQSRCFTVQPKGIIVGSRFDTTLSNWDGVILVIGKGDLPVKSGDTIFFLAMWFFF